jgi:hypothetical protein
MGDATVERPGAAEVLREVVTIALSACRPLIGGRGSGNCWPSLKRLLAI